MRDFVLDASVAAKWVLPARDEPLGAEAFQLLTQFTKGHVQFLVPDLFWPEIGSVLWMATGGGRISARTATESLRWLGELRIPTTPTSRLVDDALEIALGSGRTVYDSSYVALAVSSGRPMVTADERLVNALGAQFPVRWLGAVV